MTDRLSEIKARWASGEIISFDQAQVDHAWLIQEVERLRDDLQKIEDSDGLHQWRVY